MNRNLSSVVDLLTVEIEHHNSRRLRKARDLVLAAEGVAQPKPWWMFWRKR